MELLQRKVNKSYFRRNYFVNYLFMLFEKTFERLQNQSDVTLTTVLYFILILKLRSKY